MSIGLAVLLLSVFLPEIPLLIIMDVTDVSLTILITGALAHFLHPDPASISANNWYAYTFFAFWIVLFLKNFLVIPFKSRVENSTSYSIHSFEGKMGTVTIPIQKGSIGEVLLSDGFGQVNLMAKIYEQEDQPVEKIATGTQILAIEVKGDIVYVIPYTSDFVALDKKRKATFNGK